MVGPNSGSAGGTIPSSAIVVNQSVQRLVTVSPDVLQAAVKSGQTKIITYKPALQQPLIGGRAKVVAAEVVGSQQHKQQKKDQPLQQQPSQQQQHHPGQQQPVGKAANKLLAKILPHPPGVLQGPQNQRQPLQKTPGGVAVVQQVPSAGVTVVQQGVTPTVTGVPLGSTPQQTQVIQQTQHVAITGAQQVARVQGSPVQVVKKILPTVGTPSLNNNNNNSTSNNNNKPTSTIIVNKTSTVAQVLKAPIIARQVSEKERLREITPVLDEDALMEQIMAAEVKEQMAAVKRTMLQCVKADRDELDKDLVLNGNALDKEEAKESMPVPSRQDNPASPMSGKIENGGNNDDPPTKKRRISDDADALRSISDALTFAILSESCSAVAEEDLNAEKTIENEMSVTLPVLSSDSDVDDDKDSESDPVSVIAARGSRIGPPPRKARRRRRSYCSILAESAILLHESNKRSQSAAQELIASVADKMMEKAFGPLTTPQLHGNNQVTGGGSDAQHGPHAILNGKVVSVQLASGKHNSNDENVERRLVGSPAAPSEDGNPANTKPLVIKQMVMLGPNTPNARDHHQQQHHHGAASSANTGSPHVASPLAKKKSAASTTPQNKDDQTGVLHSRYKCQECQRGFFSAYNLRRHLKNVHKIDMGPPVTTTPSSSTPSSSSSPATSSTAASSSAVAALQTPPTASRPSQPQSHLMAALNGGSLGGPVSNSSSVSGSAPESDHDDSSLDHFVVVNHSIVAGSSVVPPKNSLAALLEAPPVHASPHI